MPKVFTVEPYVSKMGDYLMMHDDDALHTREKSLMQCMLNRDDLPAVREMVAKVSKEILDNANGNIEIVNNLLPHGARNAGTGIFRADRGKTCGPDRMVLLESVRHLSQPALRFVSLPKNPNSLLIVTMKPQKSWVHSSSS